MNDLKKKIMKAMNKAAKKNNLFIANPDMIKKLQEEGHEIKEAYISYEEYIEKLYARKRPLGLRLLHELPPLNKTIANAVVANQYEEIRENVATENPTGITINAILLLEYSMRLSVFKKIAQSDASYPWERMEKLNFDSLIAKLRQHKIITTDEKIELDEFNDKYRNTYFHMNIYKMAKDRVLPEIDRLDLATGEVEKVKNVRIVEHKALWFTAKKLFDREYCLDILKFSIEWTNKLLT